MKERTVRGRTRALPARMLRVVAALALLAGPVEAQTSLAGLDAYVEQALRDWDVPAVAVAVVKDDRVVLARGWGERQRGEGGTVDANTIFAIGSTSKAFTSAALAMLVDEGRISWDDPVTTHLPGLQLFDPFVTRELTIRDLLSHRSGLPRGDRLWYASGNTRAEILHRVRLLEPSWSFRSTYGYQNLMFLAAGEVVTAETGIVWDDFVAERIFQPLGMRRTTSSTLPLAGMENVASPHVRIDGVVRPVAWRNLDNVGPAGSINSSVAEMAEWLRLQLARGVYGGQRLLSEESIRQMRTPHTIVPMSEAQEALYSDTHFTAYGLAWSLRDYRGRKLVGHGGAIDGMRAEVMLVPEEQLGVVVLSNIGGGSFPVSIVYYVLDAYLGGGRSAGWSDALLTLAREAQATQDEERRATEAARRTDTSPSRPLPSYAGTYTQPLYGDVVVTEEGGGLTASHGPHIRGRLEHWHFDTFRARWGDPVLGTTFLTFQVDADGTVVGLEFQGLGRFAVVPEPGSQ